MQSYLQDKTVLVTGAAGFLGSHLCDYLLLHGAKVIGVDNFVTGRKGNIAHLEKSNSFTFFSADVISDPKTYLNGLVPDVILHFASPASPPRYQEEPVATYLVNSYATHLLLTYLEEVNPQGRFLFAGTSEAYGDPTVHPQPETYWGNVNPNGVRSCYDEAKRLGETICGVFYRDKQIDARIVRIFNTYGPRMNPEDGRVIPNLVMQALRHEPFTIYGDGNQSRSYCYVDDLIEGITLLLVHPDLAGETFNVGNPSEYTILETAQEIEKILGKNEYSYHPLPGDDPARRQPAIAKAEQLLSWQPKVSFQEGLQQTIEYFKAQV